STINFICPLASLLPIDKCNKGYLPDPFLRLSVDNTIYTIYKKSD
ncbi:hypothetical protein M072_1961, partial [Bacteroides fragilis str. DS-208]